MYFLTDKIEFPDVSKATYEGLLAIGGDLSPERLIHAYSSGIFPWFEDEEPLLWWSPDPRFVLFPKNLKISKSMKQVLKKGEFKVTVNKNFKTVIEECAVAKREGQNGTWITNQMIEAYIKLHQLGYAKSVEVWQNSKLVGGLYGVDLGNNVFCGESMFAKVSNASKFGFITFVQNSCYNLIDCQVHTKHLESLGAKNISRTDFLKFL
ncbi:leucyl/phenylalanyl-tRNA--protein transferase [Winogradskyella sp. J14-2]|uniref:leucyl/phenylalanyl-tRNA--protein transferase n=1 Tax=Winogradskyella sp. J14-2 TaxID=1936080 RepID=UPI0009729875|nr:leucyl/phenylalanyl-tRNA--protein transferase [Winogradskyella sp. J14-2]APY08148.1 leucyl/phenylalanyl-tRNA--protein transferase [Winogradskyella sp. J14-2]